MAHGPWCALPELVTTCKCPRGHMPTPQERHANLLECDPSSALRYRGPCSCFTVPAPASASASAAALRRPNEHLPAPRSRLPDPASRLSPLASRIPHRPESPCTHGAMSSPYARPNEPRAPPHAAAHFPAQFARKILSSSCSRCWGRPCWTNPPLPIPLFASIPTTSRCHPYARTPPRSHGDASPSFTG
jgi:hypothetical protein